ncbi:MAG: hypothetical protein NTU80_10675 [Verrucomicrobia bacterium]|nr:hypothetical protein [Verrucomicrobiota bacterium]
MNKLYALIPLVLTLAFAGVYHSHVKTEDARAEITRAETARTEAEAAAKKTEAERQARADSDRRTAERLAEEKRKEEEKIAKWESTGRQIAEDTATYQNQIEKASAELKTLETRLTAARAAREQAAQANFDQAFEIEKARVQKRNAELEIQRLVEIVARKSGASLGPVGALP